jgi:hypothetical protein
MSFGCFDQCSFACDELSDGRVEVRLVARLRRLVGVLMVVATVASIGLGIANPRLTYFLLLLPVLSSASILYALHTAPRRYLLQRLAPVMPLGVLPQHLNRETRDPQ